MLDPADCIPCFYGTPGRACHAGVFHVPHPGFLYLNIPDIPQKRRPENEIKGGISSFSGDLIPS